MGTLLWSCFFVVFYDDEAGGMEVGLDYQLKKKSID